MKVKRRSLSKKKGERNFFRKCGVAGVVMNFFRSFGGSVMFKLHFSFSGGQFGRDDGWWRARQDNLQTEMKASKKLG